MPRTRPSPTDLLFRALADTTRQRLLGLLSRHELAVGELVDALRQPQSTVSRHLKILREAQLIHDRRDGNQVLYRAAGRSRNGEATDGASDLQSQVMAWAADQRIAPAVLQRAESAVRQRVGRGADFFDHLAHRWDQLRLDCFGPVFHWEALSALLPAEWTVADIGTGTGYLLPVLSRSFRRVIAVDSAPEMLKLARGRPELANVRNVTFKEGSLSRLPIQTGRVDLAVASLVLHHLEEPAEGLTELARVVRLGGWVLIVEQHEHELAAFREQMGDRWSGFRPKKLVRSLVGAGFCEPRVRPLETVAASRASAPEAPELFVVVARRGEEDRLS